MYVIEYKIELKKKKKTFLNNLFEIIHLFKIKNYYT